MHISCPSDTFSMALLEGESKKTAGLQHLSFCLEEENVSTLENISVALIGPLRKLQKATISFVMSVRPSVRMVQLGSHWTDFG